MTLGSDTSPQVPNFLLRAIVQLEPNGKLLLWYIIPQNHTEFVNEAKREVFPLKQQIGDLKSDTRNWFSFKVKITENKNQLRNTNNF